MYNFCGRSPGLKNSTKLKGHPWLPWTSFDAYGRSIPQVYRWSGTSHSFPTALHGSRVRIRVRKWPLSQKNPTRVLIQFRSKRKSLRYQRGVLYWFYSALCSCEARDQSSSVRPLKRISVLYKNALKFWSTICRATWLNRGGEWRACSFGDYLGE